MKGFAMTKLALEIRIVVEANATPEEIQAAVEKRLWTFHRFTGSLALTQNGDRVSLLDYTTTTIED